VYSDDLFLRSFEGRKFGGWRDGYRNTISEMTQCFRTDTAKAPQPRIQVRSS